MMFRLQGKRSQKLSVSECFIQCWEQNLGPRLCTAARKSCTITLSYLIFTDLNQYTHIYQNDIKNNVPY